MTQTLEQKVDQLYQMIKEGKFSNLHQILEDIESTEPQWAQMGRAEMLRIKEKAEQNQITLAAAIAGIKAGKRRFAAILSASQGIDTYDKYGAKSFLPSTQSKSTRA